MNDVCVCIYRRISVVKVNDMVRGGLGNVCQETSFASRIICLSLSPTQHNSSANVGAETDR